MLADAILIRFDLRDALNDLKSTTRKTETFQRDPYKLPHTLDPQKDLQELGKAMGHPSQPQRN